MSAPMKADGTPDRRRDEHLDEVLCHCAGDEDGHPLSTPECTATVKAGTYVPVSRVGGGGAGYLVTVHGPTYGTCPKCGRRARVVRIETRGDLGSALARRSDETDYEYLVRRNAITAERKKKPRGPLLQAAPGMAPHRHAGDDCPGAGEVPAETRFTPGRDLADWQRAYGEDSVITA